MTNDERCPYMGRDHPAHKWMSSRSVRECPGQYPSDIVAHLNMRLAEEYGRTQALQRAISFDDVSVERIARVIFDGMGHLASWEEWQEGVGELDPTVLDNYRDVARDVLSALRAAAEWAEAT